MRGGRLSIRGLALLLLAACIPGCGPNNAATPLGSHTESQGGEPDQDTFELHEGLPPKVFKGENGVALEIVYLADRASVSTALIRFTGIDHPLSGKVLLGTRSGDDSQVWKVRFDGADHTLVYVHLIRTRQESTFSISLILPRVDITLPVEYDKVASQALSPAKLIAKHKRQQESGELARLAAADRDYHINASKRWFNEATEAIEASCGRAVPTSVAWEGFPDDAIVLPNPCHHVLDAVARVCKRDIAARRTMLAKVERIVCEYAEQKEFLLGEDKVLHLRQPERWIDRDQYMTLSSLLALTDTVVQDDQGRILAFSPDHFSDGSIYIGDGKTMRRLAAAEGLYHFDTWGGDPGHAAPTSRGWLGCQVSRP